MSFQKLIRLQPFYARHLRKISFTNRICENSGHYLEKLYSNSVIHRISTLQNYITSYVKLYSTSSNLEELVDVNVFEKVCEETLESLTEFFEELVENKEALKNADVSYSGGVLTINLGNHLGIYVINRQSPNRQIWLSSPISGPKRYDYDVNGKFWIYKHDMVPLHKLLQNEISDILNAKVDFSRCLYSKV